MTQPNGDPDYRYSDIWPDARSAPPVAQPAKALDNKARFRWGLFELMIQGAAKQIREGNAAKGFGFIPEEMLSHAGEEALTWARDRLDATAIGLIHGEVSEMMEARRRPNWKTDASEHVPQFTALVEEGADVIIRVLDLFERLGLSESLAYAIPAKVAYNATRPFKHGRTF